MKSAIYIRVSTDEQAKEGYSISAQQRKLKSFCISQDWEIADLYIDEGISAKNMERPALKRMIADIETGNVECVLVYRLDRLTRSVSDLYKLLEMFDRYDCKFKSATEVYDTTTAMGRMFITIVAALAQWERENLGERISFGFAEKARQGKYPLNFRPFGYDLDLEKSTLSVKQNEAKTVKLIYDLYIKGYGANKICQHLNSRNIRTRDGNTWNTKPVMEMLKNPLYVGHIRWNNEIVENTHEPIIGEEKFTLVQNINEKRKGVEPRRVSSNYIFSGKLLCPNCGYKMSGKRVYATLSNGEKVSYKNYRCMQKLHGNCKGSRNVSETKLESALLDYIAKEDIRALIRRGAAQVEQEVNKKEEKEVDIKQLEKELEKIEKRKKKWQYAWTDDTITYEDFKKRMTEAEEEENGIKMQLEENTVEETEPISKDKIEKMLKGLRKNWTYLEDIEKKNLIDGMIEQVHFERVGHELIIKGVDFI